MNELLVLKRKELQDAKVFLKNKYHGIHGVIDSVMRQIETWHAFDGVLYKPQVISLWGMTGVGKTGLVRDIARILGYIDSLLEIDLANNAVGWRSDNVSASINDTIVREFPHPDRKGIVVFDEFQAIRTISPEGDKIRKYAFSDIWNVLSDGRITSNSYISEKMERRINELDTLLSNASNRVMNDQFTNALLPAPPADAKEPKIAIVPSLNAMEELMTKPMMHDRNKWLLEGIIRDFNLKTYDDVSPLFDVLDFDNTLLNNNWPKGITRYMFKKKLDEGTMTVLDLFKTPGIVYFRGLKMLCDRKFKSYMKDLADVSDGHDPMVYSRLLIFVAGNVDELYTNAMDTDLTADELHETTLKLTRGDLDKVLYKMFEPEKVAKLGRQQIIYPSLNEASFKGIIRDKLKLVSAGTGNTTGVEINLNSELLVNYVFSLVKPNQGVKPALDNVSSIVSILIPDMLEHALVNDITLITLEGFMQANRDSSVTDEYDELVKYITG